MKCEHGCVKCEYTSVCQIFKHRLVVVGDVFVRACLFHQHVDDDPPLPALARLVHLFDVGRESIELGHEVVFLVAVGAVAFVCQRQQSFFASPAR